MFRRKISSAAFRGNDAPENLCFSEHASLLVFTKIGGAPLLRAHLEPRSAAEMRVAAPPPMAQPVFPQNPYRIDGASNRIIVVESDGRERLLGKDERIPGLEISICGDDNEIRVHASCRLERNTIQIGVVGSCSKNNGVRIEISENATFCGMYVRCIAGENQRFSFGRGSRIWGGSVMLDENSGCLIGEDCNCSNEIHIWGSDGHAILDKNNPEKILNEVQGPITVGDHCWLRGGRDEGVRRRIHDYRRLSRQSHQARRHAGAADVECLYFEIEESP